MKRIAVIGAGPMGLALAWHLRDFARPVVFEADAQAGGMSASFDFDGVLMEKYYHFINLPDEHLFSLLDELGMRGELRWTPTRMGFYRQGPAGPALHAWGNPVALLRLRDIPLVTRLRYGLHAFCCKYIKDLTPLDDMSAADWFRRWEGKAGYDAFWRFLFEKKFFELADPLSAAWIASRIRRVANSRQNLMQESLGYLEGGSASLIRRLCAEITAHGGEVRLNAPVARVTPDTNDTGDTGGGGIVHTQGVHGQAERFDAVITTIPLPYLPGIAPDLPASYLDLARKVRNIGCACALFRLARPLTENFWLNVDMPGWDIPGIIEYSNLRPMNKAHVYVPFYMPHGHPNWTATDDALLAKARAYLRGVNPAAAASEEAARLFRYEYAQPVCPPGFRHALPPYATGARHIWAADTTHSFPEDRSINESVRIAEELAKLAKDALCQA
jgi:protoporphyrinogen oxidase